MQATVVVEGANYPTTPGADKILADRGVTVIPDILANAGGVTGSYFEWTMNIQQFTWKLSRFNEELADRLCAAYERTQHFADAHGCTLRQAAYAIGVQRVADTLAPARLRLDATAESRDDGREPFDRAGVDQTLQRHDRLVDARDSSWRNRATCSSTVPAWTRACHRSRPGPGPKPRHESGDLVARRGPRARSTGG